MRTEIAAFDFYNPTHIVFGKERYAELATLITPDKKVLILFGGGSVERFGTLDKVRAALKDHNVGEFGGIEANPTYEALCPAIDLIKTQQYDYLLAVGGGSVIDATKFLAAYALYAGEAYTMVTQPNTIKQALPFGAILTLPATGSEMNANSVITFKEKKAKLGFAAPMLYPIFSLLDPTLTYTLPKKQLGNGVIDAYVHIMEQYMTYPINALLQDAYAESLLKILINIGPTVIDEHNHDYNIRANFMWVATNALNGTLSTGVPQDWAAHALGHEITALYGVDHGETLAVVLPALLNVRRQEKHAKLLQYAKTVWNLTVGSDEEMITAAINKTRAFFEAMGAKTRLRDLNIDEAAVEQLTEQLERHGMTNLSERRDQTIAISRKIYQEAW